MGVGITISGDSRTRAFSAATHGLAAFGHREFEVRDTKMSRTGALRESALIVAAQWAATIGNAEP